MVNRKVFLQTIWLKAAAEGGVVIHYSTYREASQMRLKLYNAVREAKANPLLNPPLAEAAHACEVVVEKLSDGRGLLMLRPAASDSVFQQAADQLGISIEGYIPDPSPLDEEESLRRLQARLDGDSPADA